MLDQIRIINKEITGHGDVLNPDLLESAFSSFHYYTDIKEQLSSIYRGLIKNHAFRDGNKRTASVVLIMLCEVVDEIIDLNDEELADLTIKVAENRYSVEEISKMLFEEDL